MSVPAQQAAFAWFIVIALVAGSVIVIWLRLAWFRATLRARAYEYGLVIPHVNKVDTSGNAAIVVLSEKTHELWLCVPNNSPSSMLEEWANSNIGHMQGHAWHCADTEHISAFRFEPSGPCEDDGRRRHVKLVAC